MREIHLSKGKVALVDDENYNYLSCFKWHYVNHGYACRKLNGSSFYMHRDIMDDPEGMQVDHINGNRLDNRKENLRVVTLQENRKNTGKRSDNSSGYKGVSYCKRTKRWKAQKTVNKKYMFLGRFDTPELAAEAFNKVTIEHDGEFSRLNKIPLEVK